MTGNALLDTNAVVELFKGNKVLAEYLVGKELFISAITEVELLSNQSLPKSEELILKE